MKALHIVLICLIVVAIFNFTVALPGSLAQQDNIIRKEKAGLRISPRVPPKGKPSLITLGDPVYDPTPHQG